MYQHFLTHWKVVGNWHGRLVGVHSDKLVLLCGGRTWKFIISYKPPCSFSKNTIFMGIGFTIIKMSHETALSFYWEFLHQYGIICILRCCGLTFQVDPMHTQFLLFWTKIYRQRHYGVVSLNDTLIMWLNHWHWWGIYKLCVVQNVWNIIWLGMTWNDMTQAL